MSRRKQFVSLLLLLLACLGVSQLPVAAQAPTSRVYLPLIGLPRPPSIFGTEATLYGFGDTRVLTQARNLGAYWMRVNGVEWSKVEPARGAPYNWAALAQIDAALASLKTLGMTPVVIVRGT
ncbi:hypothetical protein K2Z83_24595, partial [Oscillochloris sp. ZM17-4]|nr:hypothetical protein [Oscillochloris sp. ZM17-4]